MFVSNQMAFFFLVFTRYGDFRFLFKWDTRFFVSINKHVNGIWNRYRFLRKFIAFNKNFINLTFLRRWKHQFIPFPLKHQWSFIYHISYTGTLNKFCYIHLDGFPLILFRLLERLAKAFNVMINLLIAVWLAWFKLHTSLMYSAARTCMGILCRTLQVVWLGH